MKNIRIFSALTPLFFAALACVITVRAADPAPARAQTDAEAATLLTTGQWWFKGASWGNFRTFLPDGTFHARQKIGTWKIADGMVVLTFPDHVDKLILPLDPKGTKGIDANGLPLMA